jgi:type II secretory pathway pseudopilin PulG
VGGRAGGVVTRPCCQWGPDIPTAASQARRAGVSAAARAPRPAHGLGGRCRSARGRGFSYIELLVSLGIITVLLALLMPVIGKSRASAQSISCLSQLRQIASGFLQYAADNDKRLPNPFELQTSWEQLLRRYVTNPDGFHCPGDSELFPMIGSSYDWRDTGSPDTTLAGRLIDDTKRAECVLAFEALPAWHARGRMNAALLNGAALSMDQEVCMGDLQTPIRMPSPDEWGPGKPPPKWPPTAALK